MPDSHVFVVMGEAGEYEGRIEEPLIVVHTLEAAREWLRTRGASPKNSSHTEEAERDLCWAAGASDPDRQQVGWKYFYIEEVEQLA